MTAWLNASGLNCIATIPLSFLCAALYLLESGMDFFCMRNLKVIFF